MKRTSIILISASILLTPIAGYGFYTIHKNSDDSTSRNYVESVVPAIAKDWNASSLLMRAHPAMIDVNGEERITMMADAFRDHFGALQKLSECDGYAADVHYAGKESRTTANYRCEANFEHGRGQVQIGLLKNTKKEWRIFSFTVSTR